MGEMDLIYFLVGTALGIVVSRITRSPNQEPNGEPVVSQPSVLQDADTAPDIESLKEELKQTQLAYQMAEQMSQFKGGFLARTSHELRSPLSSLMGMHQLILSDLCDSSEEEREFIAQAHISAQKMVKLLDEVIAVAKTEHGTNRLEMRSLELSKVFEDIYRLTHLQAANRNLELQFVPPEPEIHVLADPRRLRQVLVSIVDSAMVQMEEGSIKVSAVCSASSEEVYIWIDIQCPKILWSEQVDLLESPTDTSNQPDHADANSYGLTLLMVNTLLEVMQGRLEMVRVSGEDTNGDATRKLTRLQCTTLLATPEAAESDLVQD
ncbi:histidine kinase dimerization/phospho-acceptor domain-containing protein [Lyngbya aestuarii]|uniref:histidine kinase dimerization/phospho-acceptor domain-containing protein n=1 Tax=Lyngbya aestuarii TaxID=118322 RepID=UPI00403E1DB9